MRRLFNIMHNPVHSKGDSVVISLDAEKAFDQIEWPYMFSVLVKFGFSDALINWIRIIYKEPTASVITNQNISFSFI